jgi:hypothetical protein
MMQGIDPEEKYVRYGQAQAEPDQDAYTKGRAQGSEDPAPARIDPHHPLGV